MLGPSFALFISSFIALCICVYYLIGKKEKIKKWGKPMKIVFYYGLIFTSVVTFWGLAYIIVEKTIN